MDEIKKTVKFTADFNYAVPNTPRTSAYKAGQELTIPGSHADAAIAAGRAVVVKGRSVKSEK